MYWQHVRLLNSLFVIFVGFAERVACAETRGEVGGMVNVCRQDV